MILLGVPPLGGYSYITPRRAGLSATAGLSCIICNTEMAMAMARQKAVELTTIWKDKNVTSALKIRMMKSMVWAVFQYGVEGWTLKKSDRNRIESFEMWC